MAYTKLLTQSTIVPKWKSNAISAKKIVKGRKELDLKDIPAL